MIRSVVLGSVIALAAFGQYKAEGAGAPPSDLPSAISGALQKEGSKVTGPDGVVSEIWFVNALPSGPNSGEANVTFATIPHGSLLGVIRFAKQGLDRRGQQVKPGIYTLRYSMFPISGDHQGVAPQRDFAILSRIGDDQDPKSTPKFDPLMDLSRKASGTPHPLVLSIWKSDDASEKLVHEGESDWVLQHKIGSVTIAIAVVGIAAA